MLDVGFVLTLLTAGLTGAGLTLAVYTLIIPIMRNILEYRAVKYFEEIKEVRVKAKRLGTDKEGSDDISNLKELLDEIDLMANIPQYLKWGAGGAFVLFSLTAMMSVAWYTGWEKETVDKWIAVVFQLALFIFLIVGFITVKDLTSQFKSEYESIKKEVLTKNRESA